MSAHNGTDGSAARAVCHCGVANGERRNGSSPAHHAAPAAAGAPPPAATADTHPADETRTAAATRRFRMEVGDTVIQIEWDAAAARTPPRGHVAEQAPRPPSAAVPQAQEPAALCVRAPLVGTFYHAPEVGARPFVGVGDIVQPGQTVGIIEVMKMMNPVTADVAGRVTDMIIGDARPVEYDQPLIALEPLGSG